MSDIKNKIRNVGKYIVIGWFLCLPSELGLSSVFYGMRKPIDLLMLTLTFILYAICAFLVLSVSSNLCDWIKGCVAVGFIFTILSVIQNNFEISRKLNNLITVFIEGSGNLPFVSIYPITDKSAIWYILSWTFGKIFTIAIYILIHKVFAKKIFNRQYVSTPKNIEILTITTLFVALCILNILAVVIYKQDVGISAIGAYFLMMLLMPIPIVLSAIFIFALVGVTKRIYKNAKISKKIDFLQNLKWIVVLTSLLLLTGIIIVGYCIK